MSIAAAARRYTYKVPRKSIDLFRSAFWGVVRLLSCSKGVVALVSLIVSSLCALLLFDILFDRWSVPENPPVLLSQGGWQLDEKNMSAVAKQLMDAAASKPIDDLPPLITGMFHTATPLFYLADERHPLRDALMQVGFGPTGNLTRVEYLAEDSSEKELAMRLGMTLDGLQTHMKRLETSLDELIFFHNYLALLATAFFSGADIATILYNGVSPATSVFWDADYDQYVRVVEDQVDPSWGVIVTSYNYPDRDEFVKHYMAWRNALPRSRAAPLNDAFHNPLAALWSRRGMQKMIDTFLELPVGEEYFAGIDFTSSTQMIFNCANKPSDVKGCGIPTILKALLGPSDTASTSGWLLQPPLFAQRPIPDTTLTTGWKTKSDPDFVKLQQAVADTFKWNAENCEVFEGLHAFVTLNDEEQAAIYHEAKQRYKMRLEKGEIPGTKEEALSRMDDIPYMLAWRLQSFFPTARWIPDL